MATENCSQINTPALSTIIDPCNGEQSSTLCVYTTTAITALGLPENSTLKQVLDAMLVLIQTQASRITALENP
jgi:hypothetical protein